MGSDMFTDLQRQGWWKAAEKVAKARQKAERRDVSDAQFRENIRRDVVRRTRIMFGEESGREG